MKTDIQISNQGSVFQFFWLTKRAKAWIDKNVQAEGYQFMGNSLVVDHRFAGSLAEGMIADGLTVK